MDDEAHGPSPGSNAQQQATSQFVKYPDTNEPTNKRADNMTPLQVPFYPDFSGIQMPQTDTFSFSVSAAASEQVVQPVFSSAPSTVDSPRVAALRKKMSDSFLRRFQPIRWNKFLPPITSRKCYTTNGLSLCQTQQNIRSGRKTIGSSS